MITAVKGNIYVLNDEIRKIIIEVNSNPVIQKTKKLRKKQLLKMLYRKNHT